MFDRLLSFLAPHSCITCGAMGSLLCDKCGLEVTEEKVNICISCGLYGTVGLCKACKPQWMVENAAVFGERVDELKTLIDEYKFSHRREAVWTLARFAGTLLPYGGDAVIVPVPTIPRHVRERGYDHMALLARATAHLNRLHYSPLLGRRTQTVQHGASKQSRLRQADEAFILNEIPDKATLYIILDDITTTGASLRAAARVLREGGATRVWTVALARQPLD